MSSSEHFLRQQVSQLNRLLDEVGRDDPVLAPQLQQRLENAESELNELRSAAGVLFIDEPTPPPRVALFLRGPAVKGSEGIRPSLAGDLLIQFEKMFSEQAVHDEREAAQAAGRRRRPRGSETPELLFTGTPRGSFGLELVPRAPAEGTLQTLHAQTIRNLTTALLQVSNPNADLETAIGHTSPRVLAPMKQFLKTLAAHDAELRLAFSDAPSTTIESSRLKQAAERLNREWEASQVEIAGTFRGLTRESTVFDLVTQDNELITGKAADSLTEEDFERIDNLTNQLCVATLQKTTITQVSGARKTEYILLNAVSLVVLTDDPTP